MNQLSNLSYTNKDFNSIYAELLQYAKDVSYRWDPTVSDESDPGVVLLKLAAIIGDKDNYNIDQNILELFPASVSQPAAARQLFEQCGYSMRHYQAAEGVVNIMFNKNKYTTESEPSTTTSQNGITYDPVSNTVSIERFTMLTDANNKVVYTITQSTEPITEKQYSSAPVIEGTINTYTVNNEDTITAQHVDSDRRLYFTELDIAENGIFITGADDSDELDDWVKVDNLATQKLGTKCYKFGVTLDGTTCFVEFPEDYIDLFGSGITIKYVRTTGRRGNIAARVLKNFFAAPDENLELVVSNPLAILNGDDPETIDDAYRSYKRVKDTFDTLVSLKDYTDYMVTHNKASNGYVCDRTNDIQRVSKVIETLGTTEFIASSVDTDSWGNPKMTAFDLCVYALEYVSSCAASSSTESETYYRKSFKLINPQSTVGRGLFTFDNEDDIKSLQHDFKGFERNTILMIKNKYPLKTTIIPRYKLNVAQQMEVSDNVRVALYEALKSKELTFGNAPEYDYIYDTILTADERIKAIALEYPTYETYAVYWPSTGNDLAEVRIDADYDASEDSNSDLINHFRETVLTRNILNGASPVYKKADKFTYGAGQSSIYKHNDVSIVTTATNITIPAAASGTTSSVTVGENEAIILTSPSLVEENKFSNYVKVLYNLNNAVSAGSYHTLASGEYLLFFWKATSTDTEYTCIKYDSSASSKAKTFLTNVNLNTSNTTIAGIDDLTSKLSQVGYTASKLSSNGDLNGIVSSLSQEVGSTNSVDNNTPCVLTGTSCITTYSVNKVHVNSKSTGCPFIYWIRNKVTKDATSGAEYYTLFENNATEYVLESGEYFFYTNSEKTVLHIAGEGTLISRSGTSVRPISSDSSETWKCLPLEYASITDITVLEDYWQEITLTTSDTGTLFVQEQQFVALGPGCTVFLTEESPVQLGNSATVLQNAISYTESTGAASIVLPHYDDPELRWKARSRLDLNVGPDKPQKLTANQTIQLGITGSATTITNKYIQADRDIQVSGGANIDLTQLAGLKLLKPATIMEYVFSAVTSTTAPVRYDSETLRTTITSTTASISVPPGNYLVSFRKGTSATSRANPVVFPTNTPDNVPEYINDNKTHFIYNITNSGDTELFLTVTGGDIKDPLIVDPYLKITDSDVTATIWTRLQNIGGKLNFDPLACAKDATIENPLHANSFLKLEHAYNKFTICEWQESDTVDGTDISVITTIK